MCSRETENRRVIPAIEPPTHFLEEVRISGSKAVHLMRLRLCFDQNSYSVHGMVEDMGMGTGCFLAVLGREENTLACFQC